MTESTAHAAQETMKEPLTYLPELLLLAGGIVALTLVALRVRRSRPDTEALTARLADRAWELSEAYPFLLLFLLLYISASAVARFFPEQLTLTVRLTAALSAYLATTFAVARHARRNNRSMQTDFGQSRALIRYAAKAPGYYLALIPLLLLSSTLLQGMGYDLSIQESARTFINASPHNRMLFAATAILAAPFFEELLLRGILFPSLIKHTGLPGALLTSSCLFALLHFNVLAAVILIALLPIVTLTGRAEPTRSTSVLTNGTVLVILTVTAGLAHQTGVLHLMISLFILSIGLAVAYWRTGSLWVSIAIHSIFNTVTLAFLYFARI
jgi:membrane protease YdiL (CAAX protease family)